MERYLAIMNTASVNMCVHVFDCYYVLYLWVELMNNKEILHLTLWGIAKLSSNISMAEIFYGPTSDVWGFHFLQILVIIYFLIIFIIAILVGGKWYFIVALIYISIMTKNIDCFLCTYCSFVYILWRNVCEYIIYAWYIYSYI